MSKEPENQIKVFQKRYSKILTRFQLIKLEKDIIDFMTTEKFCNLSDTGKNELDDLIMEIENKKEYFQTGCNPWKKILGEIYVLKGGIYWSQKEEEKRKDKKSKKVQRQEHQKMIT